MIQTRIYSAKDFFTIKNGQKSVIRTMNKNAKNNFVVWESFIGAIKGGKIINGVKAIQDYYENDVV